METNVENKSWSLKEGQILYGAWTILLTSCDYNSKLVSGFVKEEGRKKQEEQVQEKDNRNYSTIIYGSEHQTFI